jgi:hypothetical protein
MVKLKTDAASQEHRGHNLWLMWLFLFQQSRLVDARLAHKVLRSTQAGRDKFVR